MRVDVEVERYTHAVAAQLDNALNGELIAVYLIGSVVLGGFMPGRSDLDLIAVSTRPLSIERKEAVVEAVVEAVANSPLMCPASGLELVLYASPEIASPSRAPRFEFNLSTGPAMPFLVTFDPALEPSHGFVLDLAMAREHGRPLVGPAAEVVVAPLPRRRLLESLKDCLNWRMDHEPASYNTVLSACRSWQFLEEGVWSSKDAGAAWARTRSKYSVLIDSAVAIRRGTHVWSLDHSTVHAFVRNVKLRIERTQSKEDMVSAFE